MIGARRRCFTLALFAMSVLAACSLRTSPWRDASGNLLGEVVNEQAEDGGSRKRYIDLSGKVRRIESFTASGAPDEGAFAVVFDYDAAGRLSVRRFEDRAGAPIACDDGYAVARYDWINAGPVCAFFDAAGNAVARADGAHKLVPECAGEGCRCERVEYLDVAGDLLRVRTYTYRGVHLQQITYSSAAGKPDSGRFRGVDVGRVRYDYIKGVNDMDVIVEHYLSPADETVRTLYYRAAPEEDYCL